VGRPDGKRVVRRRDVGVEAVRRFKEILREGRASLRSLPLPAPPSFEERRTLKSLRRPAPDDEQDE
jgi:hypothetical protein